MTSRFSWGFAALSCLMLLTPFIGANDMMGPLHHHRQCSKCQVVEEIVYQDVVVQRCKLVPDNKPIKKTVYEIKEVPVCQKKLPPRNNNPAEKVLQSTLKNLGCKSLILQDPLQARLLLTLSVFCKQQS